MLWKKAFWPGLRDGSITRTYRTWKSPRAKVGGTYRTPGGMIGVTHVERVAVSSITTRHARAAGFENREALLRALASPPGGVLRANTKVYCVRFRPGGEDSRPKLAARRTLGGDELAELERRLANMDRRSTRGPWTRAVLELIAHKPRTRAPELAEALGREARAFKTDVRKLKNLGLTISHDVGYELSPRGRAYLGKRPK